MSYDIPILLITFNRLKETTLVLNKIAELKPTRLYISSDGPRINNPNDLENIKLIRSMIEKSIDWDCKIKTRFLNENSGCGLSVFTAIDWFFEIEEYGIILEDDCLPSSEFFYFCKDLLRNYKSDNVFAISGNLRFIEIKNNRSSILRSKYFNMWGWATWRTSWQKYDYKILDNFNAFDYMNEGNINSLPNHVKNYWIEKFLHKKNGSVSAWDYQAIYLCLKDNLITLYPNRNLIQNIGFGENATHTKGMNFGQKKINESEYNLPPIPITIEEIPNIDHLFEIEYSTKLTLQKIIWKLKRRMNYTIQKLKS